jgi:GMP synthase (glutamine-hydrolysing)
MLLQLGEAIESVRAVHGGYASWYERVWEGPLHIVDGRAGLPIKLEPRDFAGIIVTGSARSLVRPEPWMDDAADLVIRAHAFGTPVLGVCFGHQLIGRCFGAPVVVNPKGWEIGTWAVSVHDVDDPLFTGLGHTLHVNLTHQDMVEPGAGGDFRVIASNEQTPVQALAVDEHVRGIQFHPELTGVITRGYIDARRALLIGQDPDALIERTGDCPDGVTVLRNFRRYFVEQA